MGTSLRRTPAVLRAEAQLGHPLEKTLPALVNEVGLTETADRLGVSWGTVNYWCLRLGLRTKTVLVPISLPKTEGQSQGEG